MATDRPTPTPGHTRSESLQTREGEEGDKVEPLSEVLEALTFMVPEDCAAEMDPDAVDEFDEFE